MSTFSPGYSNSEAQLLMQLSALAYLDENPLPGESLEQQEARMKADIDATLGSGAPYPSGWQVAWGPALTGDRSNMMYIAENSALNQYAVVIRGTDWWFIVDWIEDFGSLLPLLPYPAINGGKIAAGTLGGLLALEGLNFQQFLKTLPADASVYVTGHSLGGCLASVVAPVVASQFGSGQVKVYTFAAPSPGDAGYQSYFNGIFGADAMAFRVFNTLDAVPDAWTTLATIETYYQGYYPCPEELKCIIQLGISVVRNEYATVGADHPLTGHIIWPFAKEQFAGEIDPIGDALFLWEVAQQHLTLNYLSLLSAQPTTPDMARIRAVSTRLRLRRGVGA